MVIHDMRNPTNSIDFALKEVLTIMDMNQNQRKSSHPNTKISMSFGERNLNL